MGLCQKFFSLWDSKKPPIAIYVRHCHFSSASAHKARMPSFSKHACFLNLLRSIQEESNVSVIFLLDTFYPMSEEHFVKKQTKYPVIEIQEGYEAGSFLKLLDIISCSKLDPDTVIYSLEDDYIHKSGWVPILREGIGLNQADYVTLYDHQDKYFLPQYENLQSRIFVSKSTHWRTTPSTTNTFAVKKGTLDRHLKVHQEYSLGRKITADHDKFLALNRMGSRLISSIPGWATHAEPDFASPCVDWDLVLKEKIDAGNTGIAK